MKGCDNFWLHGRARDPKFLLSREKWACWIKIKSFPQPIWASNLFYFLFFWSKRKTFYTPKYMWQTSRRGKRVILAIHKNYNFQSTSTQARLNSTTVNQTNSPLISFKNKRKKNCNPRTNKLPKYQPFSPSSLLLSLLSLSFFRQLFQTPCYRPKPNRSVA